MVHAILFHLIVYMLVHRIPVIQNIVEQIVRAAAVDVKLDIVGPVIDFAGDGDRARCGGSAAGCVGRPGADRGIGGGRSILGKG